MSALVPSFLINSVSAENSQSLQTSFGLCREGKWWKVQTDLITILFPAGGKKPMFLWWYSNDTSNIYVVKYKGLTEYLALDQPYYVRRCEANNLTIQELLEARYARARDRIRNYMISRFLDVHPAFLPFSVCRWNLTDPASVTREDGVSYVSFNFTLDEAPPRFDFAEGNVIIRCRFYATNATENVHNHYNYTVNAGELKMDFIVKNWQWATDRLTELYQELHEEFGTPVPKTRAGLALWTDLASIQIENMPLAEEDAGSTADLVEGNSQVSDIVVGGQRVQVRENRTAMGDDEAPMRERIRERYKLSFAKGSQTLGGFFDFVDKAAIINPDTGGVSLVNVTGAYIAAGAHMRVFISYPYFGANTLEHDPTIGVETVVPWMPPYLLFVLIGATVVIVVAVATVKIRKKTVNILSVK
jgi:hypothetical protein